VTGLGTPHPGFCHQALLYSGTTEYLTQVPGFVEQGLAAAQPVMVAVPAPKLNLVRRALRSDSGVQFANMAELGRNPSRIIPALGEFLGEQRGSPARFVGEQYWPGRSAAELAEVIRHESLINRAVAEYPVTLLCAYDVDALPETSVADAWRTHPEIIVNGILTPSHTYVPGDDVFADDQWPLSMPPEQRIVRDLHFDELSGLRSRIHFEAAAAGLQADRADDLVLAVNEVASNSILYAGGSGVLDLWRDGDGALVCEITDTGRITDPLVGRHAPGPGLEARGLWLVNHLCDLVEIRSGLKGTTARLTVCI
jgi:anti-sigma regulatory factor (Ser/Thr protein kinase)